ncbi:Schizosaccharomyces specific protein [Schizosaccharomyces osmophilus]|uniref:Schizosaccharomyces specific protein n=1 Tax=Schizosaccharomyces osmophilus TaxID=2545709 RepID=A0AAE9WEL1_9SCHI|nr:Schizosaccharomyces specific protein [Schizosaccharomyces osmophilus]WBW74458.1 Schizosaccharomyces specific protein [Schizosaccharomyces osmophilus]
MRFPFIFLLCVFHLKVFFLAAKASPRLSLSSPIRKQNVFTTLPTSLVRRAGAMSVSDSSSSTSSSSNRKSLSSGKTSSSISDIISTSDASGTSVSSSHKNATDGFITEYVTIQPTTLITTIFQYTSLASTIPAQSGLASLVPQSYSPYGSAGALIGILVGVIVGSVFVFAIVMVVARIWGPRLLANKKNNEESDGNFQDDPEVKQERIPQITYASNF